MTGNPVTEKMAPPDPLAEAVSNVFHPFLVAIPTMLIAMVWKGTSLKSSLLWTVLAVCVVILPMLLLIYRGVRSGRYSDTSISIREQRRSLYAAAGILFALLLAILILGKAPTILLACLLSALAANGIASLINHRFTKLSLHSVGMGGYTTVLLLTAPALGIAMASFTLVVGWARMRLNHHTLWQILIGWAVSSGCVLLVFWVLRLL